MGEPKGERPEGTCKCWLDPQGVVMMSTLPQRAPSWCGATVWKDGYCKAHHPDNVRDATEPEVVNVHEQIARIERELKEGLDKVISAQPLDADERFRTAARNALVAVLQKFGDKPISWVQDIEVSDDGCVTAHLLLPGYVASALQRHLHATERDHKLHMLTQDLRALPVEDLLLVIGSFCPHCGCDQEPGHYCRDTAK